MWSRLEAIFNNDMTQRRYWLYGGIAGLILGTVIAGILTFVSFSVHDIADAYGTISLVAFNLLYGVFLAIPLWIASFIPVLNWYPAVLTVFFYEFAVGALIGLIYGRIKT